MRLQDLLADHFSPTSRLGQQLRLAKQANAPALSLDGESLPTMDHHDAGEIFKTILKSPMSLGEAAGHGASEFMEAGRKGQQILQSKGIPHAWYSSVPAQLQAGYEGFKNKGGLGAAALLGLGGLGIYGAKKLYDTANQGLGELNYRMQAPIDPNGSMY